MVKRGTLLGKPTYNKEGTHLTFEYYLSSMKIVHEYTLRHIQQGFEEF